ncbi:hypothetical protein DFQ26_005934 [Actinomortierella ambigua]|nr:hypothetical protein DFQ26_005934 [Actinomortierella ambigua]
MDDLYHGLDPRVRSREAVESPSLQSMLVIGNLLGAGGYGSVYSARWGCQQCAAKSFHVSSSDFHDHAIQKEIKVLQKLKHRNIIQFYRTHEQDDRFYLIMELAEKGTLTKAIKSGTMDWPTKARIAHEIARGLEYIHQESVLHRDLKSANVLLTKHMEAKLADFGFAQIRSTVSSSQPMSSAGGELAGGALRWLAPELLEVGKPPYSTKSDIYALGMVMWEMAANCTQPYKGEDNGALIAMYVKHGHREKLPDDTPADYRGWVERCWHQDPDRRPDASEVILMQEAQDAPQVETDINSGRFPQTDDNVVRHFCQAARQGNSDAQLFLAWIYGHDGGIVNKSAENSVWWYHKAARCGSATAQLTLGEMYEQGQGVEASEMEAVNWYRKAAVHGVVKAQVKMGEMYEEGRGVQQDDAEAFRWFRMAAEDGQADAQVKVATWFSLGRSVEQSDTEAAKWFIKAAEQGNAEAQFHLGCMYDQGQEVKQSDIEAAKWFTKAAEQGNADAQYNLGVKYRQGQGVVQSDVEVLKWYTKPAEQRDMDAQYSLGCRYDEGRGVDKSDVEAIKWYTKAAERGNVGAQFNLGMKCGQGRVVDQSDIEAAKWYTKAAEQGYAEAQCSLGWMYRQGQGVVQSDVEAIKWYTKAAEQGYAEAQCSLGWMYRQGQGVVQSDVESVRWYTKAAEQGQGVEQSDSMAFAWYNKSAMQDDRDALFNLGSVFQLVLETDRCYVKALDLFRKAADNEDPSARFHVKWLTTIDNLERWASADDAEAIALHRQGAEQGFAAAQHDLARMYERGRGITMDKIEAVRWYKKAADQGHEDAQERMGFFRSAWTKDSY